MRDWGCLPTGLPLFIIAGVVTLVVTLVAATLIAPLFGESVPLEGILGEASQPRYGYGRYGRAPRIDTDIFQSTPTRIPWASDLGLGPVIPNPARQEELPEELREQPGSIDSGLVVLRQLRERIPQLEAVYEVLLDSKSRIVIRDFRNSLGRYSTLSETISIDRDVVEESNYAVAMVLAHEGQHALDHRLGRLAADSRSCYNAEARAFDLSIFIWQSLWGMEGKAGRLSKIEADFNRMAAIKQEDPIGYVERLIELYGDICGV
ncbi:MAG: hypothetical protein OXG11_13810 [Chloroflexi bacterium]|nr:hypothetical protein [Chloroflexota bacterium]